MLPARKPKSRAARHLSQVERVVASWALDHPATGVAAAIVEDDEVLLAGGFGITSPEDTALPVTDHTLFRIASTTKLLTGLAIMRLVEEGKLDLDAPISKYLPWFHFSKPGLEDTTTLRLLLSHTSGLCTFRNDFTSHEQAGLEAFVRERLPQYPIVITPGSAWLYSNAGISLAAYIAQVAAEKPYWDLMRDLLFEPLEMTSTTFDPLVALTFPFAHALTPNSDGNLSVEHHYVQNTAWEPAGGAASTVRDLAHLAIMLLNDGSYKGRRIMAPGSIRQMETPVVKMWTARDEAYGLTLTTEQYHGIHLLRHNGGGLSSYSSYFYLAPSQKIGVVLLSNGGPARPLLAEIFEQVLTPIREASLTMPLNERERWPKYTGTYLGIYTGLVKIIEEEGELVLIRNEKRFTLAQREARHYAGFSDSDDEMISVGLPTPPEDGEQRCIIVNDSPCERIPEPNKGFKPDKSKWVTFVGSYLLPGGSLITFPELKVTYREGALWLTRGPNTAQLIQISHTEFVCSEGLFTFHTSKDGVTLEAWRTMMATRVSS